MMIPKYYLYVKTHNKTGLKYLGITSKSDPHRYIGSGKDWKDHLKVHGKNYRTDIIQTVTTMEELARWGEYYTKLWRVTSAMDDFGNQIWANRIPEKGYSHPDAVGMVVVRDPHDRGGNCVQVKVTDQRYINGEFEHINKGMTTAKDLYGTIIKVDVNDPRLTSGELVGSQKGLVSVKDSLGNTMQISVSDSRYISGELEHVSKGIKFSTKICSYCGLPKSLSQLIRHERRCKSNPGRSATPERYVRTKKSCSYCGGQIGTSCLKSHESHCFDNPNRIPYAHPTIERQKQR